MAHPFVMAPIKITNALALVSISEPNGLNKQGWRAGACLQEKIKWVMQNAKIVSTVFSAVRRRRGVGTAAHAPLGRQKYGAYCLSGLFLHFPPSQFFWWAWPAREERWIGKVQQNNYL